MGRLQAETSGARALCCLTPCGVAVSPDGSKVYVTNDISNSVSVIATATNTVTTTIPVSSTTPPAWR